MVDYEIIEHTADIGIKVEAADLKSLFKNVALAMFDIIAEESNPADFPLQVIPIKQEADSLDELLMNWLNELLSLSAIKELVFSDFKIKELKENSLQADAIGKDASCYKFNAEIKAATYHHLKVEQTKKGWQAEVIFDV